MLKQFLQQQQDKLHTMSERQQQLQQQARREQQRLAMLSEHIATLECSATMKSALGLQNLAAMRAVLLDMQQQQSNRSSAAELEWQQQQQACARQFAFSKGVETVLQQRQQLLSAKLQRAEQQQTDEIAMQLFHRQNNGVRVVDVDQ